MLYNYIVGYTQTPNCQTHPQIPKWQSFTGPISCNVELLNGWVTLNMCCFPSLHQTMDMTNQA